VCSYHARREVSSVRSGQGRVTQVTSDEAFGLVVLWLLLALVPAFIARWKALGFWTFYVFGLLLWIAAMIAAIAMKDRRRRCPHCAERIEPAARVCPHCQRELPAIVVPAG